MSRVLAGVVRVGDLQCGYTESLGSTEAKHFLEGLEKSIIQNNVISKTCKEECKHEVK